MSYLKHILQPGERVIVDGRLHWIIYRKAILLLICTLVAGVAAAYFQHTQYRWAALTLVFIFGIFTLIYAVRAWWQSFTTEIAVTTNRVIYKTGFIKRHTAEMNMDKVESVDVDQSLLGRILGYGTINIRGTGASIEELDHIDHAIELRNAITSR